MTDSMGRELQSADSPEVYLAIEAQKCPASLVALHADVDALTADYLEAAWSTVEARIRYPVSLPDASNRDLWSTNPADVVSRVSERSLKTLNEHFTGATQLESGAAWVDAEHSLSIRGLQYERIVVRLGDAPDVLFHLSVAEFAFENLLRFMDIRKGSPLITDRQFRIKSETGAVRYNSKAANAVWFDKTSALYHQLGIPLQFFFEEARSVSHFYGLNSAQRRSLLLQALDMIVQQPLIEVARRIRALRLAFAVEVYYKRAGKRNVAVPRSRFISKERQWLLSGYFAGSWLKFVEYLGEQVAEDDYVSTAIPEPRITNPLTVPDALKELPEEQRARVLDSIDPGGTGLRKRFNLASEYWQLLVDAHRGQRPGMVSLWGLVEEQQYQPYYDAYDDGVYNPGLYQDRLPTQLLEQIDKLYGRETSPQYPTSRATVLFPYGTFCKHLYPALSFWHGVGLTIWFLTQGPYSRTDIPGMPHYYRRQLGKLEDLGCPVDQRLFDDLGKVAFSPSGGATMAYIVAISLSGEPEVREDRQSRRKAHAESTRAFKELKSIYLDHLERWTTSYFKTFWVARYEATVRACGQRYNRMRETKGRAPTLREFVDTEVATTVNEYFSGNIYRLLEVLGEPLPRNANPEDERLIKSKEALEQAIHAYANTKLKNFDQRLRIEFIDSATRYCILWEGRRRPPPRSAFSSRYYWHELCKQLGADPEKDPDRAWELFTRHTESAAQPALVQA